MARVPAFQAGYAGSIPVTRSLRKGQYKWHFLSLGATAVHGDRRIRGPIAALWFGDRGYRMVLRGNERDGRPNSGTDCDRVHRDRLGNRLVTDSRVRRQLPSGGSPDILGNCVQTHGGIAAYPFPVLCNAPMTFVVGAADRCELGDDCPLASLEVADRDAYLVGHNRPKSSLSDRR
jgi:hypothetical protein